MNTERLGANRAAKVPLKPTGPGCGERAGRGSRAEVAAYSCRDQRALQRALQRSGSVTRVLLSCEPRDVKRNLPSLAQRRITPTCGGQAQRKATIGIAEVNAPPVYVEPLGGWQPKPKAAREDARHGCRIFIHA
jgi:hypothetical protein